MFLLAKELNRPVMDLIRAARDLGVEVKENPAASVDAEIADLIRGIIAGEPPSDTSPVPSATTEAVIPPTAAPIFVSPQPVAPPPQPEPTLPVTPPTEPAREAPPENGHKVVQIPPIVTVRDLALKINAEPNVVIKKLLTRNIFRNANQEIPSDIAAIVLEDLGYTAEVVRPRLQDSLSEEEIEKLVPVAPVVTVMGHVDHGKTSLLDFIRKSNVAEHEAGQITQHIGAYEVTADGERIVFLDTPGHEAFTAMRARGAHVTDIAILVVAADDGVMPTTQEAIDHARAAQVPIITAINKMDRPEANPDRVKIQLADNGLLPEEWNGDVLKDGTICVPVSAKTGQGVEDLLDNILLVAEMLELKANPEGWAQGTVIEAEMDQQKGPIATVLVQKGTLKKGDCVVAGNACGRVRAMLNYRGEPMESAGPATPVIITGLDKVPRASDTLRAVPDMKRARDEAARFEQASREGRFGTRQRVSLDDLFSQIQKGDMKELNIVLKADVQGSVEALAQELQGLGTDEVRVRIIHRAVGNISESDVMLASASNAIIIGFHVQMDVNARPIADREGVEVRTYDIIYNAIDEVRAAMEGLLEPVTEERLLGTAEVRALFRSSRAGVIAGCMCIQGHILRNSIVRVWRGNQKIHEGRLDTLRRFKEDTNEVPAGMECGISLRGFDDFKEGDLLQSIETVQVRRSLEGRREPPPVGPPTRR
jgi:translation initiation factor IF-2